MGNGWVGVELDSTQPRSSLPPANVRTYFIFMIKVLSCLSNCLWVSQKKKKKSCLWATGGEKGLLGACLGITVNFTAGWIHWWIFFFLGLVWKTSQKRKSGIFLIFVFEIQMSLSQKIRLQSRPFYSIEGCTEQSRNGWSGNKSFLSAYLSPWTPYGTRMESSSAFRACLCSNRFKFLWITVFAKEKNIVFLLSHMIN